MVGWFVRSLVRENCALDGATDRKKFRDRGIQTQSRQAEQDIETETDREGET